MSIYDFDVKKRDNSMFPLSLLENKVLVIVNTAT
jgi:glutathione peroxidase-family protein